jgi:tRNA threonylcarbamoyladenosine modification (KEOPS) complex  Pcc1 subunit
MDPDKNLEYNIVNHKISERRLQTPKPILLSKKALEAARSSKEEIIEDPLVLSKIYEVTTIVEAQNCLMLDLITSTTEDALVPPTSANVKYSVKHEFADITGCSLRTSDRVYQKCLKLMPHFGNIALQTNYSMNVLMDMTSKIYDELEDDNLKPGQRQGYMKLALDASKTVLDIALKHGSNEINAEKNEILKDKFDKDNNIAEANLALEMENKSSEEKRAAIKEMLRGNNTLLKIISTDVIDVEAKES